MRDTVLGKGFIQVGLPGLVLQLPDALVPIDFPGIRMLRIVGSEHLLQEIPEFHIRRQPVGIGRAIDQVVVPDHLHIDIAAVILHLVGAGEIVRITDKLYCHLIDLARLPVPGTDLLTLLDYQFRGRI